jgi:Ca-activated chloride channel family protein
VNRSLTAPAARAGGGVEIVIGLGEDAERAARRLLERTAQPILTEVSIQGEALLDFAPRRLPDVYRGSPARIAMRLRSGGGRLTVAARSAAGRFEAAVDMPALALGAGPPAVTALFGREQVEDLEARRTVEPHSEIDPWIERIGLGFRLATRATSWVAIDESISVRAGAERRRIEQPHEIPEGLSVEALGLRPAGAPAGRADTTRAGAIRLSRAAPRRELSGADLAKDKAAPQEIEAGEDLDDLSLAQPGAPAASAMKGALGAPALADEAEEGAASMVRPEPIELPADAPERRVPFGSAAPASSGLEPRKTRGWMLWLWLLLALGGLLLWWWLR